MNGIEAATLFYKEIKARNPGAIARWKDIVALARSGDIEAIRAVRLMRFVMPQAGVMIGQTAQPRAPITSTQVEMLRQILIQARYSAPAFL